MTSAGHPLHARDGAIGPRVPNTTLRMPPEQTQPFPATLAETGAFADLTTLTPQAGLVPFEINVPLWSDGAHKQRWFCLPDINLTFGFSREGNWSRTNATLVPAAGADDDFLVHDADGGSPRAQRWHYPARSECASCHNAAAGYALGFNAPQLNRDLESIRLSEDISIASKCPTSESTDSVPVLERPKKHNQLRAMSDAGYFDAPLTNLHSLRALADATNAAVSLEYRVRSYLAANCSFCHRPDPGAPCGFTYWNGLLSNSLPATRLVNGPLLNNFGDPENRVIRSGDPAHSVLLARVSRFDSPSFHMPPLATRVVNTQAIALLTAWITEELPRYRTFAEWQSNRFGNTTNSASAPTADPDGDGAGNYLEYLTDTDPWSGVDPLRLSIHRSASGAQLRFVRAANRGYEVQWTEDLRGAARWHLLDVPDNAPFFAAQSSEVTVGDVAPGATHRFYRVRVFEP